jgi:hypothetical protein
MAEKAFRHRAAADISGADEKDVFQGVHGAREGKVIQNVKYSSQRPSSGTPVYFFFAHESRLETGNCGG